MHAFSPSAWEGETGDLCDLKSELQDRQGYTEYPCLKTKQKGVYIYVYVCVLLKNLHPPSFFLPLTSC